VARYCNGQPKFTWEKGEQYPRTTEEMIEHIRKFITGGHPKAEEPSLYHILRLSLSITVLE
jgi:hypothetical protein